ncbi:MAG: twin-arginine translocation signal domain-containing protein [Kofleriaceae bacterium]
MTSSRDDREPARSNAWRPPTRRAFVAMLGAAAAALAIDRSTSELRQPPRTARPSGARWIGHC